jgi:AraC-like DNA-binding protein
MSDNLKHISTIFAMDPSDINRHFRTVKGMTIKQHFDAVKKGKLLSLFNNGYVYGYEYGKALGFTDDHAFYHWVKRAFGVTFKELRMQQNKINRTCDSSI